MEYMSYLSHTSPDVTAKMALEVEKARAECNSVKEVSDFAFDRLRNEFADQLVTSMEVFWYNMSTKSEDATKQLDEARKELNDVRSASSAALKTAMNNFYDLQRNSAVIERDFAKKAVAVDDAYSELKKKHYTDLQKLVEERIRGEKIKFSDRLSKAEAKAMQYAKVLQEKEALEAGILKEGREKALLKQVKLEWKQKYRDSDHEVKALREG